ncbi:MAG: acetylglutamate kinase [Deltaproteobacteria bacterium]|nr:acetylglutamate kinase [Deltaproteobacteria bacterium]MCL5277939.1 acetylglutamate kinase [Deltaproteobacteria bacterium]
MEKYIQKASVLIEALPYIKQFYGKTFVFKLGGHAMLDEQLKENFARDIILLWYIGLKPIIVHGGGPQIDDLLKQLGKESRFVNGLRVTDSTTMDVVEMVLVGKINKGIVGLINHLGGKAVGISGKDGKLMVARKIEVQGDSGASPDVDMGRTGDIINTDTKLIRTLEINHFIPVIAPVAVGDDGEAFNVNADIAAAKIAASLKAEKLILLTDVEGVLDSRGRLLSDIKSGEVDRLIRSGVITGGMIPKVTYAFEAIAHGVKKCHIIDGRIPHSILLEIFTPEGVGTEIV